VRVEPLAKITCPDSDPPVVIRPFHCRLESENPGDTGGKSFGIAKDLGVAPLREEVIRKLMGSFPIGVGPPRDISGRNWARTLRPGDVDDSSHGIPRWTWAIWQKDRHSCGRDSAEVERIKAENGRGSAARPDVPADPGAISGLSPLHTPTPDAVRQATNLIPRLPKP
jgi:hypothetical protein